MFALKRSIYIHLGNRITSIFLLIYIFTNIANKLYVVNPIMRGHPILKVPTEQALLSTEGHFIDNKMPFNDFDIPFNRCPRITSFNVHVWHI